MIFDIDKFDFSNPDKLPFLAVYYDLDDGSETFMHLWSCHLIIEVLGRVLFIREDRSDEIRACWITHVIPVDHISCLMWVDYNEDYLKGDFS